MRRTAGRRRTHIPAFYTDWFLARLAKGWCACPNPFTRRLSLISFARTRFIVFWSKNPRPLLAALPHLQRRGLHGLVQYTLNDYEQEGFEHVPALPTRLETFRLLSQALGRKALIWRFDPLLLTDRLNEDMLLARIARLADSLGPYTEQLVFSFADIAGCRKARNNLQRSHIAWQEWTKTRMEDFAGRLSLMKHRHGWPFSLATCCEEIELGQFGIAHARCIDADRIVQLGLEDRELLQGMGELFGLLVETMEKENMAFPLHLGVTEAGDGEDGRIKSAVGIGALLADGIGDTIRVSLSEAPEKEIPVAQSLVDYINQRVNHPHITLPAGCVNWEMNNKTTAQPIVIGLKDTYSGLVPDYYYEKDYCTDKEGRELPIVEMDTEKVYVPEGNCTILLGTSHPTPVGAFRAAIVQLRAEGCQQRIVLHIKSTAFTTADMQLQTAADTGVLFIDGMADGLFIEHAASTAQQCVDTAFSILQAARVRTSKTEYISCPGCGRTMFNLEKTIALIKKETSHLTGLKIGIMGCIVNGPGEMADADYGYVGAGRGKISLYKQKECIEKNIPEEEAVEHLIALIKQHNDWKEK